MTKKEYAILLATLIGETLHDEDETQLEDQFYFYFQSFMPHGNNLEKVFEPLPNGELLYQRIKPIFSATEKHFLEMSKQNSVPAYFVVPTQNNPEKLNELGQKLLENLILFSEFIEDETLTEHLKQISEITIADTNEQDFNHEIRLDFYEIFSDWQIDNQDNDDLISVLNEAYYSINCDYLLSAYLQYPDFKYKPEVDFLEPYFELWKMGYGFVLNDKKLILYP